MYGQHIARDIIYSAVQSHVHHNNPKKPLVLSFHGVPGSGKNYAASMVAQTLFKNKDKSYFYYFFNGRHDFPMDTEVNIYKVRLIKFFKVGYFLRFLYILEVLKSY